MSKIEEIIKKKIDNYDLFEDEKKILQNIVICKSNTSCFVSDTVIMIGSDVIHNKLLFI